MESIAYAAICITRAPMREEKKDAAAGFSVFSRDGETI